MLVYSDISAIVKSQDIEIKYKYLLFSLGDFHIKISYNF